MSEMIGAPNGFSRRYAIRLPDGSLYTGADPRAAEKAAEQAAIYYNTPSPMRDMSFGLNAILGIGGVAGPPASPKDPQPRIFDTYAEAVKLFEELDAKAQVVGVHNWGGCIVESLSTPFTSGDPAEQFAEAVMAWVTENGLQQ